MSDFDDLEDDFAPVPFEDQVRDRLSRHESRRQISDEVGLPLETVDELAAIAIGEWAGRRPPIEEEIAAIHWAIDDTLARVMRALHLDPTRHDAAELLQVRLEALRLQNELIRAERTER